MVLEMTQQSIPAAVYGVRRNTAPDTGYLKYVV